LLARISRSLSLRTFSAVTLTFLVAALVLGWEALALRDALMLVDHADEVIGSDRELVGLTIDMETGLRGYLLTKDESFLDPFEQARAVIDARFDALDHLVADDRGQRRRLAEIRKSYADWLRQSDPGEVEHLRPGEYFAVNSSAEVQSQRKAAMDLLRAEHLAFRKTEEALRRERFDQARGSANLVNALLALVLLLGVGGASFGMKQAKAFFHVAPSPNLPHKPAEGQRGASKPARRFLEGMRKSWSRSIALTIGIPAITVLLSIPISPYSPSPFTLFYGAVSVVAWTEGLWWAFCSLALSLLLADFYLISPVGSFSMGPKATFGLVIFASVQLVICWLIDSQKHAARMLRDQAGLLDLSHDGIMVRELDGTIRLWNHGAEEMYGYTKQQAEGRKSHEILRTVFPQPLAEIEADLERNGRWEGELGHATEDGRRIVVESRWVLQNVGNGAADRVFEINNDISERKRAEEASLRDMQALMRSNKELDEFAYAASHDLKAPLRVIDNASKWLEEDLSPYLTGETRENMNLLRGRVARLERLLEDLLEYSRIGRKADKRSAETLSAQKLLEDVLELLSPPRGFTVSLSPNLAGVEVRRMPLQQIFMNLIGNAIKHHHRKTGNIEISVEDTGAYFQFAVRDDGPGIPAQFHEQVFKMFQTLKPRDQVEGSGMGLAMVHKYVEVSGGTVALESAEGQGSTFRFTWPKQQRNEGEIAWPDSLPRLPIPSRSCSWKTTTATRAQWSGLS
jgi:two-component system sensor kinase FixL